MASVTTETERRRVLELIEAASKRYTPERLAEYLRGAVEFNAPRRYGMWRAKK